MQVVAALISLLLIAKCASDGKWQDRVLPDGIGVPALLGSDSASGFREGCRVAVYRLTPATSDRIRRGGLAWLAGIGRPRDESPGNLYSG